MGRLQNLIDSQNKSSKVHPDSDEIMYAVKEFSNFMHNEMNKLESRIEALEKVKGGEQLGN